MVKLRFVLLVAVAMAFASGAHAQSGGFLWSERSSSQPSGGYVVVYNTTGTTISDGTIVMSDTTSSTLVPQIALGKGFSTYIAGTNPVLSVHRIIGVLVGDTPGYSQGRVLVYGWHNHVLLDASAIAAMSYLRPSLSTSGALGSWAATDSVNNVKPIVGQFQRYATSTSLYGYCKVDFRSVAAGSN